MLSSLLSFAMPSWVSLALKAAPWVLAAGGIGYGLFERNAVLSLETAQKVALAEQKAADAALSTQLLTRQATDLAAVHAQTVTALKRVQNAPVTSGCGPSVRDAARSVRDQHRSPAQP